MPELVIWNYVQLARRRWAVIVLLGLLVPAISLLFSQRRDPVYAALSEVLVKRQYLAASLTPGQVPFTDGPTAERIIETQIQLARVPDLADRVITAAGLAGQQTAADLLGSSTVTARAKSDILVFRVESPVPGQARVLAGAYAEQFTTYRRQLDTAELEALANGVRAQLASIDSPAERGTPLFADLQDKLRQIQTLQALQTSSAVVVRRADSAVQVGPTSVTVLAGGLLLGLMLGGGLVLLLESLDTRVRRSSEVMAILGIPLLARLPAPPAHLRKRSALVEMEEPDSAAAEAFAFLRTSLTFANALTEAKVIMFCSAVEQEGKSTSVCNLAVALARSGSRVLLVDVDYRRPTVHSLFGISRSPGVTEVSNGAVAPDQAIRRVSIKPAPKTSASRKTDEPWLEVLPAGGATHHINVDAVVAMLDGLRDRADVVLVDAPPLLLVGEALALSARMDGLVVVTRLNYVRKPLLEELRRTFDSTPMRPVGFVATAAAEEPGYSHYFGKPYGYAPLEDDPPGPDAPESPPPPVPQSPAAQPSGTRAAFADVPAPAADPVTAPAGVPAAADPVTAPAGPRPRDALSDALRDAVFANGSRTTENRPAHATTPGPAVGIQPRRSWAEGGRRASTGAIDEVGSSDGDRLPPENGTEGEGGGDDG